MENDTGFNWTKIFSPGEIIGFGVIVAVLIGLASFYGYANGVRNEAIAKEVEITAQYSSNQNELANYVSTFYETVGVANVKRDALDKILTDAVKGRYEGHTSAQPGSGQLFSAIKEAYPNLDLTIYDKIVDFIKGGREAFKNKQDSLLDKLRDYDTWRAQGFLRSWALGKYFPSDHLRACIAKDCVYGVAAETRMQEIVTNSVTQKAYQTDTMEPLTVPK